MAYYLNKEGLICLWERIKEFLKNKYVAINDNIIIKNNNITHTIASDGDLIVDANTGTLSQFNSDGVIITKQLLNSTNITSDDIAITNLSTGSTSVLSSSDLNITNDKGNNSVNVNVDSITMTSNDNDGNINNCSCMAVNGFSTIDKKNNISTGIMPKGIVSANSTEDIDSDDLKNNIGSVITPDLVQVKDKENKTCIKSEGITTDNVIDGKTYTTDITGQGIILSENNGYAAGITAKTIFLNSGLLPSVVISEANIKLANNDYITDGTNIDAGSVESHKFVKTDGTNSQLLVADGSVVELNKPNGIPQLDNDGKLDTTQVDFISNDEIDTITK